MNHASRLEGAIAATMVASTLLWFCACGEPLLAPVDAAADAASPDAVVPVELETPVTDSAPPGRDGVAPRGSPDAVWSFSPPEADRVLAIVPHPTSAASFGVLTQDPDDVVRFKITTDLGRSFSRARFIGERQNAQVRAASWSRTDTSLIGLLLGEGVLAPFDVLASVDAGRYFSTHRQHGPSQRVGYLSTEGGALRVRVANKPTSSTLYTFDVASAMATAPLGWTELVGAPGHGPFAVRPSLPSEVLAVVDTTLMRCSSGVCASSSLPVLGGDVRISELEFNPSDDTQVIAKAEGAGGVDGHVLLSRDAGVSFTVVHHVPGYFQRAFFERRAGSSTLFALAGKTVMRSPDAGRTWHDVTPKDDLIPGATTAIYVYDIAARAGGGLVAKGTFNYYFLAPQS
jgi:hypothetical protein